MQILHKFRDPKTYYNFKSLTLLLYIIISIVLFAGMTYYVIPEEVKQACIEEARKNSGGFISIPIGCYINPFGMYLLLLNMPGILFTEYFSNNSQLSDNFTKLPNVVEYFLSDLGVGVIFLISILSYMLVGHMLDLIVRFVRRQRK